MDWQSSVALCKAPQLTWLKWYLLFKKQWFNLTSDCSCSLLSLTHSLVTTLNLSPSSSRFYPTKCLVPFNNKALWIPSVPKLVISLPSVQSTPGVSIRSESETSANNLQETILKRLLAFSYDARTLLWSITSGFLSFFLSGKEATWGYSNPLATPHWMESARKRKGVCLKPVDPQIMFG